MKFRRMGSLDWEVSALGFGCMRLPRRRRWLLKRVDGKEAVAAVRTGIDRAALCTACGACVKKCPQGLDVPAELEKVHAVLAKGKKVREFPDRAAEPAAKRSSTKE
ncbi:MAG: 4Fe-4S dicluster domain-containing protein [Deltaproteobacteria bacterium]|nr:4Fe-4S dicluster domain-containing protein [Deltaproteobacteria bacterium]